MNNNAFWAFFVVAIIAGFAIGMFFLGPGITGFASFPGTNVFGETDSGLDYTVAGTCTDAEGTHQDYCGSSGVVFEYTFNGQFCSAVAYNCVLGGFRKCEAGACVDGKAEKITQIAAVVPNVGTIMPEAEPTPAASGGGAATAGAVTIPTGTKFYGTLSPTIIEEINTLKEEHSIIEKTECREGHYVSCCWGSGCEHGCCWPI